MDTSLQGRLFDEACISDEQVEKVEQAEQEIVVGTYQRRRGGRKPLPAYLPRKQVIHDLPQQEQQCACGSKLCVIGEEKSEQLEVIPAQCYVIEHIEKKYACKHCHLTIKKANKPAQPLMKSLAGPGLLAHVLTEKFEFHLPLYRQEQRLKGLARIFHEGRGKSLESLLKYIDLNTKTTEDLP